VDRLVKAIAELRVFVVDAVDDNAVDGHAVSPPADHRPGRPGVHRGGLRGLPQVPQALPGVCLCVCVSVCLLVFRSISLYCH
jgi:hypothetical protein